MGASGERRGDRAGVMPNPSDRHDIMPLLSSAEVGFIRLRPAYERPNLGKPKSGCESGDPYSRGGDYGSPQRGPRDASVAGCPSRGRQSHELMSPVFGMSCRRATVSAYRLTITLRIAVLPPLLAASALCRAPSNSARFSTRWPWKPKWLPNSS